MALHHWDVKPPVGTQINRNHTLARKLYAMWVINEGVGITLYNTMTNGLVNAGIFQNPPAIWTGSILGYGINLNGTNQYIDCGNIPALGNATAVSIFAAGYVNSSTSNWGFGQFPTTKNSFGRFGPLRSTNGQLNFYCDGGIKSNQAYIGYCNNSVSGAINIGMTYDGIGQNLVGYVNGVQQSLTFNGVFPTSLPVVPYDFLLGYDGNESAYTNGRFDVVLLWVNRVVTPADMLWVGANPNNIWEIFPSRRIKGVPTRGTGNINLNSLTVGGIGLLNDFASGNISLNSLTTNGTGLFSSNSINNNISLNSLTTNGIGLIENKANGNIVLNSINTEGTGAYEGFASGDILLEPIDTEGTGSLDIVADGSIILNTMHTEGYGGAGANVYSFGDITLSSITTQGIGINYSTGDGNIILGDIDILGKAYSSGLQLSILAAMVTGKLFTFTQGNNMNLGNNPDGKDCLAFGNQSLANGLNTQAGYSAPCHMVDQQTVVIKNMINLDFYPGCQVTLFNLIGSAPKRAPSVIPCIVNNISTDGTNTYLILSVPVTDYKCGNISLNTDFQAHSDGTNTIAAAINSYAGGYGAVADLPSKFARGDSYFQNQGDGQYSFTACSGITVDDTPVYMLASNRFLKVRNNHSYAFVALISGYETNNDNTAGMFLRYGIVQNLGNIITLSGVNTLGTDINPSNWTIDFFEDNDNFALSIIVTGEIGSTVHWKCRLDCIEVG